MNKESKAYYVGFGWALALMTLFVAAAGLVVAQNSIQSSQLGALIDQATSGTATVVDSQHLSVQPATPTPTAPPAKIYSLVQLQYLLAKAQAQVVTDQTRVTNLQARIALLSVQTEPPTPSPSPQGQ